MSGRPEWVYFVVAIRTGLVKIGRSNMPTGRLGNLQVGSPDRLVLVATMPGGADLEDRFHLEFRGDHVRGEWFRLSARIRARIESCGGKIPEGVAELSPRERRLEQIASLAIEHEQDHHAVHGLIEEMYYVARCVGDGVTPEDRHAHEVSRALDQLAAKAIAWSNSLLDLGWADQEDMNLSMRGAA